MASKQTRRSISISGTCYEALKERCDRDGTSMSGVVEELVRKALGMSPRDVVPRPAIQEAVKVTTKQPGVMVVTTKELKPEPISWKPASEERIATIRAAHDQVKAKEVETVKPVEKKPGIPRETLDAASKIFTF